MPGIVSCAQQKGPKSYPKLHLPLETLRDLFDEQLRVELSPYVCIPSVEKAPVMTKEVTEAVRASSWPVGWSREPSPGPGGSRRGAVGAGL